MNGSKKALIWFSIATVVMMAIIIFATSKKTEVTFPVKTGDTVVISIKGPEEYFIEEDENRFMVKRKDGEEIFEGGFIATEDYEIYTTMAETDKNATINKQDENYIYWTYDLNGKLEHSRAIKISDKTAIVMGSHVDKEIGDKVYKTMKFEIKNGSAEIK